MLSRTTVMARAKNALALALDLLEQRYGKPKKPVPESPLEWIVWENVAYLVDDDRRERVYRTFEARVGLTAEKIDAAKRETIYSVTQLGGMHPEQRIDRLKDIAERALAHGGGDMQDVLGQPLPEARKILKQFPSIGDPGADKILLFTSTVPLIAFDSNGLRVATRLGFGEEKKSYAASYKSARAALEPLVEAKCSARMRTFDLLRTHGQVTCKRTSPDCDACPLMAQCRYFAQVG